MEDISLGDVCDLLIKLARQAGELMLAADPGSSTATVDTKQNTADLVTETDKAIENSIRSALAEAYPSIAFLGEETHQQGQQLTLAPVFIVDPIDGTTNFIHGYPHVCVSLALVANRESQVGVVYNPFLDQLYTAIKGQGSFLTTGSRRLRLPLRGAGAQPLKDLSTCVVAAEWGYDRRGQNFEIKKGVFAKLAAAREDGGKMVHALRAMGSATLNMCAVAAGQQDVYWEGGAWVWDVAAAYCILKEAGGLIAGGNPGDWDAPIDGRKYLAVRPASSGQEDIVKEFWSVMGDQKMEYNS
ncbi:inositol monophosphatase [Diplogelasinospora grovesii]|uniref:Inositol-1-monophosphatase n=1 Tax=Diplogelasinospora grovesii TaxID=303347 RepID=A0AAN6S9R4_9PEZI|nr:inositol monophosphatase [Diplogelasinospora grovesii]